MVASSLFYNEFVLRIMTEVISVMWYPGLFQLILWCECVWLCCYTTITEVFRTTLYHLQVWVPSVIKQYIATNAGVNEPCTWHTRSSSTNNLSKVVGHPHSFAFHHVGGSLHLPSQSGDTPLTIASYKGHPSVVRILLKAGANINTTTQVRYRLFMWCQDFVWQVHYHTVWQQ